jgi:CHAT domain-containing protein
MKSQVQEGSSWRGGQSPLVLALSVALLAGCQRPPPTAYIGGKATANISLGANTVGEACTEQAGNGGYETDILCGSWDQPAARVVAGGPASSADLSALVTTSSWRAGLDRAVSCPGAPTSTEVLGQPAMLLSCTRRIGGWPHVALATVIGGRAYYADGVSSSLPVMERAIGVQSGVLQGEAASQHQISPALAAQRLAASALSASDLGRAETSLDTAASANRAGDYAEAETAYASVAALQKRVLGPRDPGLARTLAGQAVQASNLRHYNEAERLLDQAETLARAPNQTDENALPLVWHDRGLQLLNEHKFAEALVMLRRSEAAYKANLHGAPLIPPVENSVSHGRHGMALRDLFADPAQTAAIIGVVENERDEAVALRRLNRLADSESAALAASKIAEANELDAPDMQARLLLTSAFVAEAQGQQSSALLQLASSSKDFGVAFPDSPAYGRTTLLLAARQAGSGDTAAALLTCRTAIAALRSAKLGMEPALLLPCLKLLNDTATDATADAVHKEMFEAAELAQGSVTSQQIAEASARLSENARDPRVAALIKERADLKAHLSDLLTEQQEQVAPSPQGGTAEPAAKADPALNAEIAKTQAALAEKNAALQAAAPNFGSLVQEAVTVDDLSAALRPGEVFCSIMLGPDAGWSFLVAGGKVSVAQIAGGSDHIAGLVQRVRASLDTEVMPPPPFDIAAAQELYQLLLGPFTPQLQQATALTVAPTGPLLSLPFGLLLSGPAKQVPAPANLVSLRKLATTSRATTPWFGFGDFRPVTQAQAIAAFPPATCGDSAALLAGLPPLPGAQLELETVRKLTGAPADDQLLGPAFTATAVLHAKLKQARILHFATHALLSTDLKCQTEPALVTSAPRGAVSAEAALLPASQVTQLDLDAQTVILSACNTGGAAGGGAGESLSGLARSFFYAGARSMLVTHWAVNDRVTAYLVALAVAEAQHSPSIGIAGGLAAAQRKMLSDATGALSAEAHPFYWAPLAVIGDGRASLGALPPA